MRELKQEWGEIEISPVKSSKLNRKQKGHGRPLRPILGAFKTVWQGAVVGGQANCHFTIPSIAYKPPLPQSSDFHLIHYEEACSTALTWFFSRYLLRRPHKPQLHVSPQKPMRCFLIAKCEPDFKGVIKW